jgi:ABC-2 type transport system permease protein
MGDILYTRFLLWKKRPVSMLFWLLLPIIGTLLIIMTTNTIQKDSRVPVGMVVEDDSRLAEDLMEKVQASNLVQVYILTEEEALYQLEKHDLDSVFVIHKGYEDSILKGKRNNVLSSYQTDLSLAYAPVKEMIVSLVQEETGREKAVHFILNMKEHFHGQEPWTRDEIIEKSKKIQQDENLLNTAFRYYQTAQPEENITLISWNTWGLWAIFSFISTLFLSDWVIQDKAMTVTTRFSFMKISRYSYYLFNIFLYALLFLLCDLLAVTLFLIILHEPVSFDSLINLVTFRIMLTGLAFSIANSFQSKGTYYAVAILFTLIVAVISGSIIPINGLVPEHSFLTQINPLQAFLSDKTTIIWGIISILLVSISLFRKERLHA